MGLFLFCLTIVFDQLHIINYAKGQKLGFSANFALFDGENWNKKVSAMTRCHFLCQRPTNRSDALISFDERRKNLAAITGFKIFVCQQNSLLQGDFVFPAQSVKF